MMKKQPYSYTVLRYVHDVMTGEFINVGLVVYAPKEGFLQARMRSTIGRLRDTFPDLDRDGFRTILQGIERSIEKLSKNSSQNLFSNEVDARSVAISVLPADDSSLQWSPPGSGTSTDLQNAFERLYERMVSRYDLKQTARRTDDEIWRPVRQKLEERKLADRLHEKVIHGSVDEIKFKHAWKNGAWHVYEGLSLDLADADGIKDKARRWLGHLTSVSKGAEQFIPHFIVGGPSNPKLQDAYEAAIGILKESPSHPVIYTESQTEELVAKIEDEVREHSAGG